VLRFNSAGPEVINGRLAMIGVLAAAAAEPSGDQTALYHMQHAPWWAYLALALAIQASLVPLTKGAKMEGFGERPACAAPCCGPAAWRCASAAVVLRGRAGAAGPRSALPAAPGGPQAGVPPG
jgi:hypothetical protein